MKPRKKNRSLVVEREGTAVGRRGGFFCEEKRRDRNMLLLWPREINLLVTLKSLAKVSGIIPRTMGAFTTEVLQLAWIHVRFYPCLRNLVQDFADSKAPEIPSFDSIWQSAADIKEENGAWSPGKAPRKDWMASVNERCVFKICSQSPVPVWLRRLLSFYDSLISTLWFVELYNTGRGLAIA